MTFYKCSILANPEGDGWIYAKGIYDILSQKEPDKFELNPVELKQFRDGEFKPKLTKNVRKRNCFFIHDSNLKPEKWLADLLLINGTLSTSHAHHIVDVFPYLKFSRQDRKDESRVPISSRIVADAVGLYANSVLTIDLHNDAIQGFYKEMDNLYSFPVVIDHLKKNHSEILENLLIASTDAGGAPRARNFAKRLGMKEIIVGNKYRAEAGKVEKYQLIGDVEDIRGRNVLYIDDILDSGITLNKAEKAAREKGARKVYAYTTHALFTKGIELVNAFDGFFVGDTIIQKNICPKLEVISFIPLFAEAIRRVNEGESLSSLLETDNPK
ncbi:MAG: ribose-phosphate diphosphokinase [Candidatus Nanoarchaeia archaeon]|nr:ribose-phosphate diphosphokinase [Candidatus Nanoarchaeia archaeon]MDD5588347.1 ribose-phosphate diphosphokinase [Candidatus Nanoarchaeia archaeon]